MTRDSTSLVAAACAGDPHAFEQLIELYAGLIRHLVSQRVDRSAVDDLVQDTFLKAWNGVGKLRDPRAFKGWIMQLTLATVNNWLTRRRTERGLISKLARPEAAPAPPEEGYSDPVMAALDELSPEARAILNLRVQEGLNAKEIGEALGLGHDVVRQRQVSALRKLREQLKHKDLL